MARRLGWTEEQIASLDKPDNSFTSAEKAAVRFAEAMTLDARNVDESVFQELRRHFNEGEVVEIAAIVGLFNYYNRFNDALQMESSR